jgi:endo-1,3(4)-beta-glucanase
MNTWIILSLIISSTFANYLLDPISLDRPPFEVITHSFKPVIPVTQKGPIQTNKFWGNLVSSTNNDPVHAHPYVLRLQKQNGPFGLAVACDFATKLLMTSPVRMDLELDGQKEYYVNILNNDLTISSAELNVNTEKSIIYHDVFGCHLQIGSVASRIVFPIFRGMAYVTAEYESMTPSIFTISFFKSVNGQNSGVVTGTKFKIEIGSGQIWILYSSKSISLTISGNNILSTGLFTGTLRLARIPANNLASESTFDTYSGSYIVGGDLDIETTANKYSANYVFNWKTKGSGELLHFALPHHAETMLNNVKTELKVWSTVKGEMTAYVGSTWKNLENGMTNVGFLPLNPPDANRIPDIKDQLIKDINEFPVYPATVSASNYFGGKGLSKLSNLCLLAKELSVPVETYQKCITMAKDAIKPYLENTNMNSFRYDCVWGGIIGNNGLNCTNLDIICSGMDFGASYYNDHHYHYGYLIYASAVLAKLEPQFGIDNKVWVENLIRDVGNPSKLDPYFPVFRSFDWYVGHSYSQGVFASADGKDQESTSEEVNYHYAVYLWGLATNNPRFENLGNLMFALNRRSIQKYFLMRSDNIVHPKEIVLNKVTGINFENKVHYTTWFGFNTEYIHGIQMIPYLPVSESVREFDFVSEEWELRLKNLNLPNEAAWKSLLYLSYATVDKNAAWEVLKTVALDDGLTRSWALYSCASRQLPINKTPAPTPFNPSYLNFVVGSASDWDFSNVKAYRHKSTSGFSALTLKNSMTSSTDFYVSASFTKVSDQSQFGVVMNYKTTSNGKQLVYAKYGSDGNTYFCLEYVDLKRVSCTNIGRPIWNIGDRKTIKLRNTIVQSKQYYTIYVDNTKLTSFIVAPSWGNGEHGILVDKETIFDTVFISSPTNVKITLTDCSINNDDVIQKVAQSLGVSPSSIVGLQRFGCSKKKNILAAESISFNIVGSQYTGSSLLASKLQQNPPSNFEEVEYSTSNTAVDLYGINPVEMVLEPTTGLGVVGIVSLVAAIAAVVAGLIVGAVVLIKKKTTIKKPTISPNEDQKPEDQKSEDTESDETPKKKKPQGASVNIYNLDPNNITSITARAQNN